MERKRFVYDNASDLYNSLLTNYKQQYRDLDEKLNERKKSKCSRHNVSDLFLDGYK